MRKQTGTAASALAAVLFAGAAHAANPGDVIISEVFYATNQQVTPNFQDERVQEFIEIFNTTNAPIDVSGWRFVDAGPDGEAPSGLFPMGTVIPARSALAICGYDTGATTTPTFDVDGFLTGIVINDPFNTITLPAFQNAWSTADATNSIIIYNLTSLSNSPNLLDNEIYQIQDETGAVIDEVNYDDAAPWPTDTPQGTSIFLLPFFLDATSNDQGEAWRRSDSPQGFQFGAVGSVLTLSTAGDILFEDGNNTASPGFVDETIPPLTDCNTNGVEDAIDIFNGTSSDCDGNGVPDECDLDCDGNGIPDLCEINSNPSESDCNNNGLLDSCEIDANPTLDNNNNGIIDACESSGLVVITEIMYNPASSPEVEWVEIWNASNVAQDISGFTVKDLEDTFDTPGVFPAGTSLAAGEAAVVIDDWSVGVTDPTDPLFGLDPVAEFESVWGITPGTVQIIAINDFGSRANNGSPGDEVLALLDANGFNSDVVDYDAVNTPGQNWPADDGTGSVYLLGNVAAGTFVFRENNDGENWGLSIDGISGAYSSTGLGVRSNSSRDTGSPGFVPMTAPVSPSNDVFITEIFSVQNSEGIDSGLTDELGDPILVTPQNEWVEIYNSGASAVDISGWFLRDEDGSSGLIPAGTTLAAGEVAVLFGEDVFFDGGALNLFGSTDAARQAFYDAWGCGYQVIVVDGWRADLNTLPDSRSLRGLSNGPSSSNEVLTLRDSAGALVDLVNYDDDGIIWPLDGSGDPLLSAFSVTLLPGSFSGADNDDGTNWTASFVPFEFARDSVVTTFFNGTGGQVGSPGSVDRSGTANDVEADLLDCPAPACIPDVTTTNTNPGDAGFGEPDGVVDGADLSYFVEQWLGLNAAVADVTTTNTNPGDAGYGSADGVVDGADLSFFVEQWLANCL